MLSFRKRFCSSSLAQNWKTKRIVRIEVYVRLIKGIHQDTIVMSIPVTWTKIEQKRRNYRIPLLQTLKMQVLMREMEEISRINLFKNISQRQPGKIFGKHVENDKRSSSLLLPVCMHLVQIWQVKPTSRFIKKLSLS